MNLFNFQFLSFGLLSLFAIVVIILERFFPYNKNQLFFRKGFWTDLIFYNFIQSFVLGILISFLIVFIDNSTHLSRLKIISDWPIFLQLLFFIVTHDLYIYWFHKLQHKNKYLWRLHEAHHSAKEVDWISGVRSHSFEILINQTIEFLPILLLGAPPQVAVAKGLISGAWGIYIHSNINVKSGVLQYVINGPEMHRLHHSIGKGRNKNFSTKLAIWDWIFSTSYFPKNEKAKEYGLKTFFPENYFRQFLFAFRKFKNEKIINVKGN
ncbi:MAG: sterol desaturase family protein [Ignavibacteriae bacterium]|nr:sterol desaturase family protein [Ignavibacteriota bacterium]